MTNWIPTLSNGDAGPLYQRLADSIEAAIDAGSMPAGVKLPPQRDLAFDLKTTVGTVGRAYSLLRERGLVSGEVGRGTYVLARQSAGQFAPTQEQAARVDGTRLMDAPADKIRFDSTGAPDVGQGTIIAELLAEAARENPERLSSYSRVFPDHWFTAGSQWLARNGFQPAPDTIMPTLGVHAGAIAVISALTAPGDQVVFEHLTYSQVARGSLLIGRRPTLVQSDAEGMDPDDFERVCAQKHPKAAFLMPTAHNPTAVSMPAERREAIARVARAYNVLLIEDDLYGHMSDDPAPLLAEFAPERTIVIGGLSKSVAAGIRGGWLSCPPAYRHRIRVAHKLVSGGMPFLLAEISARLVLSGQALEITRKSIAEINLRLDMMRQVFGGCDFNSCPNTPFVWLSLPDPWLSGTFKNAAYKSGVLVDDEDEFKAGRSEQTVHRIRFGISQPSRAEVSEGLAIVRRLLDEGRAGYASYE
ncbi:MAG: PLP-dependent aminotransferase family protein [Rhizobiaceae bacterium]